MPRGQNKSFSLLSRAVKLNHTQPTIFNVVLLQVGQKKIHTIKIVREWTELGLKEAKELVESKTPQVVHLNLLKYQAEKVVREFRENGSKAAIVASTGEYQTKRINLVLDFANPTEDNLISAANKVNMLGEYFDSLGKELSKKELFTKIKERDTLTVAESLPVADGVLLKRVARAKGIRLIQKPAR